jgi:hypothetical protein
MGHPSDSLSSATEERRPAIGALRVPRDEACPPLVVAGVVALVLASLAVLADVAVPAAAAVPVAAAAESIVLAVLADVAVSAVARALAGAEASVVLAVPALWAWPGVPAGLGVFAEQVAPAELAAPVPGGPAGLAWAEEPAGRCVLPVPAFLLEGDAMVWESAVDAAVQPEPGLVHAARREEAGSLQPSAADPG